MRGSSLFSPNSLDPARFATVAAHSSARCSSSPYRSSWSRNRLPNTIRRGSSSVATRGSHASSTSKRPSEPRCSSRAVATPQVMFDPARLWTGARPAARRAAAIMPAVVVLPLVALTIVVPPWSLDPSRASASGAIRKSSRPGRVVPPPLPLRRESAPAARAITSFGPNRRLTCGAGPPGRSPAARSRPVRMEVLGSAPADRRGGRRRRRPRTADRP